MLGQLQDAAEVYETSMPHRFQSFTSLGDMYNIFSTLLGFFFE